MSWFPLHLSVFSSGNVCNVQEGLGCSGFSKSFSVDYLPGHQALTSSFLLRVEDNS